MFDLHVGGLLSYVDDSCENSYALNLKFKTKILRINALSQQNY